MNALPEYTYQGDIDKIIDQRITDELKLEFLVTFKDFEEIYQIWLPEDVVITELCKNDYQAFYPISPEEREIYTLNEELDIDSIEADIPPLESELEAMLNNCNLDERNSTPLNDEQIESTQSNARLENLTNRMDNLNTYKNILTYAMLQMSSLSEN